MSYNDNYCAGGYPYIFPMLATLTSDAKALEVSYVFTKTISFELDLSCTGHGKFEMVVDRGEWDGIASYAKRRFLVVRVQRESRASVEAYAFIIQKISIRADHTVVLSGLDVWGLWKTATRWEASNTPVTDGRTRFTFNTGVSVATGFNNVSRYYYDNHSKAGDQVYPTFMRLPFEDSYASLEFPEKYIHDYEMTTCSPKIYTMATAKGYVFVPYCTVDSTSNIFTPHLAVTTGDTSGVPVSDYNTFVNSEYEIDDSNRVDVCGIVGVRDDSDVGFFSYFARPAPSWEYMGGKVVDIPRDMQTEQQADMEAFCRTEALDYLNEHQRYITCSVQPNPGTFMGARDETIAPSQNDAALLWLGWWIKAIVGGTNVTGRITASREVFKNGGRASCELTVGIDRPSNAALGRMV